MKLSMGELLVQPLLIDFTDLILKQFCLWIYISWNIRWPNALCFEYFLCNLINF